MANSAVAAVAENVSPAAVKEAAAKSSAIHAWTGQYLYDRFVANDDSEVTKLGIVRHAVETVDTMTFKSGLKDMIKLAKETAVPSKLKTAQNHASVMRIAYGALKFARGELNALNYTDKTGYHEMRHIGRLALERAGVTWDGHIDDKGARERVAKQRAEQKLLKKAMDDNPRNEGENLLDWQMRCGKVVETMLDAAIQEETIKAIDRAAKSIIARQSDIARGIAERILILLDNPEAPLGAA